MVQHTLTSNNLIHLRESSQGQVHRDQGTKATEKQNHLKYLLLKIGTNLSCL